MYALKRIFAYAIDTAIVFFLAGAATRMLPQLIFKSDNPSPAIMMLFSYASLALYAGLPTVLMGTLAGGFGWTPGKLISCCACAETTAKLRE
jgi:hypothetical protein